ncbi:hypothetical protein SAMN04487765_1680 [Tenacibaculum sp. MAR_2010_89]|uniref:hypothetical protein n=1 Tax=Tenacibaculum sp. MAR_2010_89 TaxID=1250198 RepID=UPI000894DC93|nr:hypothetical protein [Tenacibaculum sp. MAR_2010_89]SEE18316.1 hypothetical protein SAMN04487765_1680 [Tenacibaculum sp. MAR_2010_89]
MKKKEELLLLFDKEVTFRKLIPKKSSWLIKATFNNGFKLIFLVLIFVLTLFLGNAIFNPFPSSYTKINNYLNLIILVTTGAIFIYALIDEYLTSWLIEKYNKKYLSGKSYKKEKHLIFREIQSDYLLSDFFKDIDRLKVKKIRKELKEDLKTFSNVFNMSESTFAILLVPLGLAILQWYFEKVKLIQDYRVVYVYAIIYLLLILAVFFTFKSIKNTYYLAKKEKHKRLIYILKLLEKKIREREICEKKRRN